MDITELQDERKPLKKRSSEQFQGKNQAPQPRKRKVLDQKRLEARRKSNRLSAQRARIRTKTQIKELEDGQAKLRATNSALCKKLQEVLLENQEMRRMMETEVKEALERNRVLQELLMRRITTQREQRGPTGFPKAISSPATTVESPIGSRSSSLGSQTPSLPSVIDETRGGPSWPSRPMPAGEKALPATDAQIHHLQQEINSLKEMIRS